MASNEGGQQSTGTRDVSFNLTSVLYHALEAASTAEIYVRDAEQSGQQELAQFFRETQDANRRLADRAKQLLKQQLG
jgi:rubrerythrin